MAKRPRGRPKTGQGLLLNFRASAMERARYLAAAEAKGEALSAWLRRVATEASDRELSADYEDRIYGEAD